ncbi:MAG TPA: hypothetical protein VMH26_07235 [Burkholderiales bacterium]|nr:hypothetical protein [Burkholderiales bacterium]
MRSLRLFLPQPLPVAGALAGLPALARILSRARAIACGAGGWEAALLESFGVQRQCDWPVAPLSWLGDGGEAGASYWLRADPVHLRAERDALVLIDGRHFALEAEAASALVQALNAHFESDGLRFFAPSPMRWYVAMDRVPEIATSPLRAVAGRSVEPLLPQGDGALTWHRWFNDIQMMFHIHAVNEARESAGQATVNSVWFWGGGVLPARVRGGFAGLWGEDPLARGLARAAGLPWTALPENAAQWLAQAPEGEHVVVLDPFGVRQRETLEIMEHGWFAPLLRALRQRLLSKMTLLAESGDATVRFELGPGDLWKFWRRMPALVK